MDGEPVLLSREKLAEKRRNMGPYVFACQMLQDPKADALASDLAGQWFQTLGLADVVRDPERFPQFTEDLREAMAAEVELLLRDAIRGQLSAKELLTTDVSYINHDLAELYGLDATSLGQELERTPLGDPKRGGLLRTAAFLTVNAEAGHNSPVRRGKWVLERLLCDPPPPPPANVPGFEPKTGVEEGSLRDQLEAFFEGREVCAGCHDAMNPIGFAFEHYDSLGRFRETDNGFEIDTSGTLYGSGASFDGVDELISAVIEDDRFASCMVEKVFAYALGRDLRREDESVIAQTAEKFKATDYRFPDLFELVATSRLMTERSPESP